MKPVSFFWTRANVARGPIRLVDRMQADYHGDPPRPAVNQSHGSCRVSHIRGHLAPFMRVYSTYAQPSHKRQSYAAVAALRWKPTPGVSVISMLKTLLNFHLSPRFACVLAGFRPATTVLSTVGRNLSHIKIDIPSPPFETA